MKVSSFWHYIEEVNLFWNSLNFTWLEVPQAAKEFFQKGFSSNFEAILLENGKALGDIGFFANVDQEKNLVDAFLRKKLESEIKSLYLIMSTNCNLACSYCLYGPVQSGSLNKKGANLSRKEISDALQFFLLRTKNNNRSDSDYWEQVTFYGGEPLLNPAGIKHGIKIIQQAKRQHGIWENLKIIIDTNGTLIDDDFIDFSIRNRINVQVSIDGPKEIHDLSRKCRNGNGTFERVRAAMSRMSQKKLAFLPLITVSPSNIQVLPSCVEWLVRNFDVNEIGMNLLMYTESSLNFPYGSLAADAMIEAHSIACKFGVVDSVFSDVLNRFSSPSISPEICGAGVKVAAFPGGALHACQALENCGVGFLGQASEFDEECQNWQEWKRRSRFSNAICLNCPVLGFCGGGCAASAFVASGNLNDIDPYYCDWMKRLFHLWITGKIS